MTTFEFDPDVFGVTYNTYGIYQPGRIILEPDQLSVTASLREQHTTGRIQWLALLERVDQAEDESIHAQWVSGYGVHENLLREVTGDPNAELRTHRQVISVGKNLLSLEGVCGVELDSFVPRLSICGRYFAETPEGGQMAPAPLDDSARRVLRELSVASSLEIMRLKQLTEGRITLEHCFEIPGGDFTEFASLKFDLNS